MKPRQYPYIDALRGIAILMVVMVHVGQRFPDLPTGIASFTWFGQYGVQLFFVASAITLCMSWQSRRDESKPIASFLIRRYFRIAPMYYLGILIYPVRLLLASIIGGNPIPDNLELGIVIHLFLLHGAIPVNIAEVVPGGWSIGCEFLFYLAFPFLIGILKSWKTSLIALVSWTLVGFIIWNQLGSTYPLLRENGFVIGNILIQLPVFICGFLAFHLLNRKLKPSVQLTGLLATMGILGAFIFRETLTQIHGGHIVLFALLGIGFGSLALALSYREKFPNLLLEIGKRSFSIYILHFLFTGNLVKHVFTLIPVPSQPIAMIAFLIVTYLFVVTACYLLAGLTFRFIERPFVKLGNRIIDRMQAKQAQTA